MKWRLPHAFALLLGLLNPASVRAAGITEYPLPPGSTPNFLAFAHDGSIAVTEYGRDKIGRLKAGVVTEVSTSAGCGPIGITLGADGFLFYTCTLKSAVGVLKFDLLDPVETMVTHQPVGPMVSGPDGNLWYTVDDGMVLLDRQRNFLFAAQNPSAHRFGLAAGGDGGVWAVDPINDAVIRYRGDGSAITGSISAAVPTASAHPRQIAWCQGFGGAVVSQFNASKIAFAQYVSSAVETSDLGATPSGPAGGIACGSDGAIWYTVPTTNKIGRILNGTVQEFSVPTAASTPYGILIGEDGSIWFTENGTHKIGRLRLRPQGDVDGNGQIDVADVFYLINFLFAGGPVPVP
jgi:virginiamycin B lyase